MTTTNTVEKNVKDYVADIMDDIVDRETKLWHRKLSHLNLICMRKISFKKAIISLSYLKN